MTNNKKQTPVEWLVEQFKEYDFADVKDTENYIIKMQSFVLTEKFEQAKEMENEKHEKFNKFLNDEKQLGISDLKTIERIQWYYNTYFNETYGGNND
jgi:hypothetical protein